MTHTGNYRGDYSRDNPKADRPPGGAPRDLGPTSNARGIFRWVTGGGQQVIYGDL